MARRRNILTVRVDDAELEAVRKLAKDLGVPVAEVWRKLLTTVRVLYDSDLMLGEALKAGEKTARIFRTLRRDGDIPLYDAIKPIPEIMRILEAKSVMRALELDRRRNLTSA